MHQLPVSLKNAGTLTGDEGEPELGRTQEEADPGENDVEDALAPVVDPTNRLPCQRVQTHITLSATHITLHATRIALHARNSESVQRV